MPSVPTIKEVIKFNAIQKLKILPIRFITKITIPPNIELPISFATTFIGPANILPRKNKNIIPIIYKKAVLYSMFIIYHFTLYLFSLGIIYINQYIFIVIATIKNI